jgi:hypothetical protein
MKRRYRTGFGRSYVPGLPGSFARFHEQHAERESSQLRGPRPRTLFVVRPRTTALFFGSRSGRKFSMRRSACSRVAEGEEARVLSTTVGLYLRATQKRKIHDASPL